MRIVATTLLGPGTEKSVGEAVSSAAPFVDAFLFIESGGGERALAVACEAASAAGRDYKEYDYEWTGDYGAARHFALECARGDGADWSMTLDPDERLDSFPSPERVREELEKHPTLSCWYAKHRDEHYLKERLIRCSSDAHWVGRSCEILRRSGGTGQMGMFWELPHSPEHLKDRFRRGIENMKSMVEIEPDEPRWVRHMSACHKGLRNWHEALIWSQRATSMFIAKHQPEPAAWCMYQTCEVLMELDRLDEAFTTAAVGLATHAGHMPEFASVLAHVEFRRGKLLGEPDGRARLQNASRWAQIGLMTPEDKTRAFFRSFNARYNLEQILGALHGPREVPKPKEYNVKNYAIRAKYREDYAILAKAWCDVIGTLPVHDAGAGNGLLVEALSDSGVKITGSELSELAYKETPERVRHLIKFGEDLTMGLGLRLPVISCLEVLEHIPEEQADAAVEALSKAASEHIVFSAAKPGQGGVGHINEQPSEYWEAKFARLGWSLDIKKTRALTDGIRGMNHCWWLPRNIMVLSRGD